MRGILIAVLSMLLNCSGAFAQPTPPSSDPTDNPAANSAGSKQAPAPTKPQPQGSTGPTSTTSGGASASSPQGDSPPGMQPEPHDPKQGIDPKK